MLLTIFVRDPQLRACWDATTFAAAAENTAVTPSQAAAMAQEAAAAYRRCRAVLPPAWQKSLQRARDDFLVVQHIVQAHVPRSPNQWQPSIISSYHQQAMAGVAHQIANLSEISTSTCDACGQASPDLRRCAGCKSKQYVTHSEWVRANLGGAIKGLFAVKSGEASCAAMSGKRCCLLCMLTSRRRASNAAPVPFYIPAARSAPGSARSSTGRRAGTRRSARCWPPSAPLVLDAGRGRL